MKFIKWLRQFIVDFFSEVDLKDMEKKHQQQHEKDAAQHEQDASQISNLKEAVTALKTEMEKRQCFPDHEMDAYAMRQLSIQAQEKHRD